MIVRFKRTGPGRFRLEVSGDVLLLIALAALYAAWRLL